ncbi:MAG: 5-deoxy-glucuronate isomerase [Bryobacteraceae bacterium]
MAASILNQESCVVRATNKQKGRTRWLVPEKAAVRYLHYGRIILDSGDAPLEFSTGTHETGLICLGGRAAVEVAAKRFELGRYDALYVPRESAVRVTPAEAGCDLAEISAPVTGQYPLQFVSFADVRGNPTLHFLAGGPSTERDLNILIGKNVEAGRIVAGVTFSKPGNWTSWPPHEHAAMLEEAYLYIDMPAPSWGLQLVYTDPLAPELVVAVREGDVVVMPAGYHPNVAAPGGTIGFMWMMAAHREVADRQFGVVNVQPEYAERGSGLEAAHGKK